MGRLLPSDARRPRSGGRAAAALLAAFLLLAGCVSKGEFVAKSREADLAASALAREREKSSALALRAARLEAQLAEVQRSLEAAVAERDQLRAELTAARGTAARLEGQLAEASDQRDTLAKQLAIARQAASERDVNLHRVTYEYDTLIAGLEREKGELSQQVTELSGRLAEAESRMASLTAERDRLDGERLRLDVRVQELTAELAAAHEMLGETQQALAERERKLRETTATYDRLVADLQGEIAEGQVTITRLQEKLTVNLVDRILFDSGSVAIKPGGQEILRKVAEVLRTVTDKQIQIEGHTDNVPVGAGLRSRFPTNWELSAARATVVARFLQEEGGISPARLAAVGYGEHRPVASNDTPDGRAQNRRIEIVLTPLPDDVRIQ